MSLFPYFRQRINIKYFMIGYLFFLLSYSSFYLKDLRLFFNGISIVMIYVFTDLLWTYIRDRVWYLPSSSLISGLILSIVAFPNPSIILIIILPFVAVLSKQLIHLGKNRHIFNPASFAMAAVTIFTPAISWWGIASSRTPNTLSDIILSFRLFDSTAILFLVILLAGIFILWRQNRWHIALSFMFFYAVSLIIFSIAINRETVGIFYFLRQQIISGIFIFFSTVMLIEPITSTFSSKKEEVVYGGAVGLSAGLIFYLSAKFNLGRIDPLVYGLLAGDFIAGLIFLEARSPTINAVSV